MKLSIENVKRDCLTLGSKIECSGFVPDYVIYLETGGYLVGKELANYFNVPCYGIKVHRKGNGLKEKLGYIIAFLPKCITKFLRTIEVNSGVHRKKTERFINTTISFDIKKGTNILIADDSVDTGNSVRVVKEFILNNSSNVNIKIASLNRFSESEQLIKTQYNVYSNFIITYPWSKDSDEYNAFLKLYNERK